MESPENRVRADTYLAREGSIKNYICGWTSSPRELEDSNTTMNLLYLRRLLRMCRVGLSGDYVSYLLLILLLCVCPFGAWLTAKPSAELNAPMTPLTLDYLDHFSSNKLGTAAFSCALLGPECKNQCLEDTMIGTGDTPDGIIIEYYKQLGDAVKHNSFLGAWQSIGPTGDIRPPNVTYYFPYVHSLASATTGCNDPLDFCTGLDCGLWYTCSCAPGVMKQLVCCRAETLVWSPTPSSGLVPGVLVILFFISLCQFAVVCQSVHSCI